MIAIFDSGFGGLTVLKPILKKIPQYDYVYLGDNARAPYGNHSRETIIKFSEEAVNFLFNKGAKLIIFACNTASSNALRYLQQKYLNGKEEQDRKILGVLIPIAEKAGKVSKNFRVGLVGTRATVNSKAYESEIMKINPNIKVYSKACPLLVPIIEEGWQSKPEATSILKKYLRDIKSRNIDTLILGCTHYPIMTKTFKKLMGKKVNILDTGDIVAESLMEYLERHPEIEKKLGKNGTRTFLTSDDPERMQNFAEKILFTKISKPQKVNIELD